MDDRKGHDSSLGLDTSSDTLVARRAAFDSARLSWPEVDVPLQCFEKHLESVGCSLLSRVDLSPLYLCAGCMLSLQPAFRALESVHFPALRSSISRLVQQPSVIDDVLQDVRLRLLVGSTPKIATYRGTGPFMGWLRVIAVRSALDYQRSEAVRRRRAMKLRNFVQCEVGGYVAARSAPEDAATLDEATGICQELLQRVLLGLSPEDRQLLQNYFVHRMSIDDLGKIYGINRSTAARRVARTVDYVRRRLNAALEIEFKGLTRSERTAFVLRLFENASISLPILRQAQDRRNDNWN